MDAISDSVQAFEDTMRSFDEIKCHTGIRLYTFWDILTDGIVVNKKVDLPNKIIKQNERENKVVKKEIYTNKVTFKFTSNGQKGYKGRNWR